MAAWKDSATTLAFHTIRSHEKLTAGGMTLLDTDVIRLLDEVLPARFGGAPTDYQLVEHESDDGEPGWTSSSTRRSAR